MAGLRDKLKLWIVATFMLLGVTGEALVLFFLDDPVLRLRLGMTLLGLIVWPIVLVYRRFPAEQLLPTRPPRRRFSQLRRWVHELIREVRRLNWVVVDTQRGFRSEDSAQEEIDAIEHRLLDIIERIKNTAGQRDPESEAAARPAPKPAPFHPQWIPDPADSHPF